MTKEATLSEQYKTFLCLPPWPYGRFKEGDLTIASIEGYKAFFDEVADPSGSHAWLRAPLDVLGTARDVMREWGYRHTETIILVPGRVEIHTDPKPSTDVTHIEARLKLKSRKGKYLRKAVDEVVLFGVRGGLGRHPTDETHWSNMVVEWPGTTEANYPGSLISMVEAISPPPYYAMFADPIPPGWVGA